MMKAGACRWPIEAPPLLATTARSLSDTRIHNKTLHMYIRCILHLEIRKRSFVKKKKLMVAVVADPRERYARHSLNPAHTRRHSFSILL